jgi:hypothetical protein
MVNQNTWDTAVEKIERELESKRARLESGACSEKEYATICGFISGVNYFLGSIKDASKPKSKRSEDDGSDADGS